MLIAAATDTKNAHSADKIGGMPDPPDLFAELRLRLEARQRIEELAREGLEHQRAGRLDEARKCLETAEEIEEKLHALRDRK